ncbi:hypothetical protein Nepgr_015925 [Nepenthes gracilis]|uniref:Uncharacterized protein n=1 Tax=Nepenthes gracilis TaxID=150966 RepID=A0AAD3XRK0_NEPGR|nr:hypothetical protein Nepgr_015925 [Nepenthes gracilis]
MLTTNPPSPLSSYECFPSFSSSSSSSPPSKSIPPPYSSLSSILSAQGVNKIKSHINKQNYRGSSFSSHVHDELLKKIARLFSNSIKEIEAMVSSIHAKIHMAEKDVMSDGEGVSVNPSAMGEASSCEVTEGKDSSFPYPILEADKPFPPSQSEDCRCHVIVGKEKALPQFSL